MARNMTTKKGYAWSVKDLAEQIVNVCPVLGQTFTELFPYGEELCGAGGIPPRMSHTTTHNVVVDSFCYKAEGEKRCTVSYRIGLLYVGNISAVWARAWDDQSHAYEEDIFYEYELRFQAKPESEGGDC